MSKSTHSSPLFSIIFCYCDEELANWKNPNWDFLWQVPCDSSGDNKVMFSYMYYIPNIFSNNHKLLLMATLLISTFTFRSSARYEVLIRKSGNLKIFEFHFTGGLKMKWLISRPNILNKEVTWLDLKLTSEPLTYFDVRVIYICATRFKNLRYNSV